MPIPFLEGGADPFGYVLHHNTDETYGGILGTLGITKFTLNMMFSAALLVFLVVITKKTSLIPKGKLRGIFESCYLFIRDDMVYPALGEKTGEKFLPFFITIFTFILTMNLVGMLPLPYIGGAATSQLSLTAVLAVLIVSISVIGGIVANGPGGFIAHFVPGGVPTVIVPLIFVLEVAGFVIKHSVLAVRLMANMLGGHLVVGAFIALIPLFNSYAMAGFSVPMVVFINFLELLVAFLQAYVFTLLAILFIGSTLHPDH